MGTFLAHSPNGMGLATTAVLAALLDRLIANETLGRTEVAYILENAAASLRPHTNIVSANDALNIVSKLTGRFQENA
jgi:hypothetical protein